jgi:peptide/nickel transport system permease protein
MARFLLRRLLLTIPVVIGIIFVTFVLVRSIPGNPCQAMLGEKATQETCANFLERFGLNDNVFVQFAKYAGNLISGDFGNSIKFGRPVGDLLLERLPLTLELTIGALFFAIMIGVPLGIISAYRRKSMVDATTMVVANLGVSMPIFWLGLLLQGFFGLVLKDTFFQLPTSSRMTAGLSLPHLVDAWNLQGIQGFPKGVLTFFDNMFTVKSLLLCPLSPA